jgi:hypothetical protein
MSASDYSILRAMDDPRVWRDWFNKDKASWRAWRGFLAVLFGLDLSDADLQLFRGCTGRQEPLLDGYQEIWLCIGRRGGKSFVLALIAVFLAVFRDWRPYLAPGETGRIIIVATDRRQARVIHKYCRALLINVPSFVALVEKDIEEEIILNNGVAIEIHSGSFRGLRGFTCIAALLDEIAYWRSDETFANPDVEILNAIRPTMATVPGAFLLAASSPFGRQGALWEAYKNHYGQDGSRVLVWQASTRQMNPSVSQWFIDEQLQKDPARAASEYLAQFREGSASFIRPEVVEAAVVRGRYELAPERGIKYAAFCDPSGGSGSDSMTLAIAHNEYHDGQYYGVLDLIREVVPPFSPEATAREFADVLHDYGISQVTGDRFAGEWPREQFLKRNVVYVVSEKTKSEIYLATLPALNSGRLELLDHPRLISQLCSLERQTGRSTGREVVDHPRGLHDDVCNAVAGALVPVAKGSEVDYGALYELAAERLQPRHPDLAPRRRSLYGSGLF